MTPTLKVASASRVMFGMEVLQAGTRHMGVDLRGRQITVAEQHLHHPQVGAAMQQMAGKGVAQHVGRHAVRADPGTSRQPLEIACENLPRQSTQDRGQQFARLSQRGPRQHGAIATSRANLIAVIPVPRSPTRAFV